MSVFRRDRDGPDRVNAREAAARTGRRGAAEHDGAVPLVARGADAVGVIGGTENRARAGLPVVDRHGGSGTVT
ncbi:hypothetical protein SUDANB176_07130 [Streptomyces sp. enrichment culture]|uniref:hypothetical protein n=1 Tax=Streptomyces sp. enrichment culture TaxID=1795815 RepID=UPI003F56C4FD